MSLDKPREGRGFVHFFTDNSVAANVLMVVIIAAGLGTLLQTRQEVFPEFSLDVITVAVPYPGATPSEIEESIATKIEEAIQGVDGIKRLRSSSNEGAGVVTVEVREGEDIRRVLDDVKTRVDAIDTFPDDAEEPVVRGTPAFRQPGRSTSRSRPRPLERTIPAEARRTRARRPHGTRRESPRSSSSNVRRVRDQPWRSVRTELRRVRPHLRPGRRRGPTAVRSTSPGGSIETAGRRQS